jgi:hypothetical protein
MGLRNEANSMDLAVCKNEANGGAYPAFRNEAKFANFREIWQRGEEKAFFAERTLRKHTWFTQRSQFGGSGGFVKTKPKPRRHP